MSDFEIDPAAVHAGAARIMALGQGADTTRQGRIAGLEDFGSDKMGAAFAAQYPDTSQIFQNRRYLAETCQGIADGVAGTASLAEAAEADSAAGIDASANDGDGLTPVSGSGAGEPGPYGDLRGVAFGAEFRDAATA